MALIGTAWLLSQVHSLLHILLVTHLSFCASHQVPHLFCDHQALLSLSCLDTHHIQVLIFTEGAAVVVTPFLLILASYGAIAAVESLGDSRLCPPVAPTWLWWASSTGQSLQSTSSPPPDMRQSRAVWPLSCTW